MVHMWKNDGIGQWIVAVIVCLSPLSVGVSFSWSTPVLPKIMDGSAGFKMSKEEQSIMLSVLYAGNMLSPLPAGYIMNKIGRRWSFFLFNAFTIVGWIITITFKNATALYAARFLLGTWNGAAFTIGVPYVAELVDPRVRSWSNALQAQSLYIGAIYVSLISKFENYDLLNILAIIPSILLMLGILLLMPESPYYSLMKGRRDEARKNLIWLRGAVKEEEFQIVERAVEQQMSNRGRLVDLLAPGTRLGVVMASILVIIQRASGMNVLFTFFSLFIPTTRISYSTSFIIVCLTWISASFSTNFIINKYGRRTLFTISCAGVATSSACISTWYYLRDNTAYDMSPTDWMPLVLFMINSSFFGMGLGTVPMITVSEVFPVNVKGIASAVVTIIGSLASGIVVQMFYFMWDAIGLYSNFLIFVTMPIIGILFMATVMIETKGKTLEEIQEILIEAENKFKKKDKVKISEKFAYTNYY